MIMKKSCIARLVSEGFALQNSRCKLGSALFTATVKLGTNKGVFNILLKLKKESELSCKPLGREFYAVVAEKPKLLFPYIFLDLHVILPMQSYLLHVVTVRIVIYDGRFNL